MGLQAGSGVCMRAIARVDISMWREASDNARQEALETRVADHISADEEKSVELLDGCFEDDMFFEFEFLFEWLEGVFRIAACECEPLARLLAEAGGISS